MSGLRLSVVVASAGRPEALCRCLLGLSQLAFAGSEVVVVADRDGLDAVRHLPFADRLKLAEQVQPNISAARNTGIGLARGDVVAFIDDDAVPEPTWSSALLAAFADPDIAAVTGPVLGRNGISLQWGPMGINNLAQDVPVDPARIFGQDIHRKLQGTNMAFRRETLRSVGGFDEAYAFYLDDTDMAFRIGRERLKTAWLPGAFVHHGFQASSRRTETRVPVSLFDIGASTAVYLRKHAPDTEHGDVLRRMEAEQSSRLLRLARARKLDPDKMRDLMEGLQDGVTAGMTRAAREPAISDANVPFLPLSETDPPAPVILSGRPHQLVSLRRQAAERVANGQPVSLFCFGPTPRKHKIQFTDGGWWEQIGGLFGPSDRAGPRLKFQSFQSRLDAEIRRISATRGLRPRGDGH